MPKYTLLSRAILPDAFPVATSDWVGLYYVLLKLITINWLYTTLTTAFNLKVQQLHNTVFWLSNATQSTILPPPHHNCLTALFPGPPRWDGTRRELLDLWCKGRLTEADTVTIRLGATPSGLSSAHLHHPPNIFSIYNFTLTKNECWTCVNTFSFSELTQFGDNNRGIQQVLQIIPKKLRWISVVLAKAGKSLEKKAKQSRAEQSIVICQKTNNNQRFMQWKCRWKLLSVTTGSDNR